ncbi:hypothetical protein A0256_22930 [Mucilaginibacter sp. PAMC 26640]|nr:hypothetical protein A0256_22930 [Mucilaginibacter sp. PAMC 26640]
MEKRYLYLLSKSIIAGAFLLGFTSAVNAQTASVGKYKTVTDSLDLHTGYSEAQLMRLASAAPMLSEMQLEDVATQKSLQLTISKAKDRKALMQRLRNIEFREDAATNHAKRKFFFNLGNTFARLRLYSLAMKCYFKTLQYKAADTTGNDQATLTRIDSLNVTDRLVADTTLLDPKYLGFNIKDDSLLNEPGGTFATPPVKEIRSPKITYTYISEAFKDGKKAVAYAMLMHVKQPVAGKRKVYRYTDSGHSFITLIKYNSDSTYISVSFGFYPDKNHLLAGTPLFPSSPSVFRDDARHNWDEVAGKFISKRRFERIIALTKKYDGVKYNLNSKNCTDFSLDAAFLADVTVGETTGKWPLGHGNNPGITGLSILNGKVFDGGRRPKNDLFVSHDLSITTIDK